MKQCKFCGESIPDNSTNCPYCCEPQEKAGKKCPFCDEIIDAAAVRCPVCGETLPTVDASLGSKAEKQPVCTHRSEDVMEQAAQVSVEVESQADGREADTGFNETNAHVSIRKKVLGIVATCAVVLAVGIGCFFIGKKQSDNVYVEYSTDDDSDQADDVINAEVVNSDATTDEDAEVAATEEYASDETYAVEAADDVPLSSSISDWSMIDIVELGSDEAYARFREGNSSWERLTATGELNGADIRIDGVRSSTGQLVGRYYNGSIQMDVNGSFIDDILYLQIGQGLRKSFAVLRQAPVMGYISYGGTWGKHNQSISLDFGNM